MYFPIHSSGILYLQIPLHVRSQASRRFITHNAIIDANLKSSSMSVSRQFEKCLANQLTSKSLNAFINVKNDAVITKTAAQASSDRRPCGAYLGIALSI